MRSGKELIKASLPFAKEDKTKSWYYTITTTLLLCLAFVGTFNPFHISLQFFFSVVFGLLMVKFFILYHDYNHFAILKNSTVGKVVMNLFGIFILAPITIWKRTHDYHHINNSKLSNNGVGSYPLLEKSDFYKLSKKKKFVYLASRHPLTIFAGYITLFIFDFNIKTFIQSPKKHWDSIVALIIHFTIGFYIFQYGGILTLLISWIGPFVLANLLGSYLFYAQHNFPGAKYVKNKDWNFTDAAIKSTSFMRMGAIMNWFTGDIGYHHIHHLNHHIPFYRLKEAMNGLPEMQNPIETSFSPKDVWACLRLKVWDAEKGEMTSI